MAKNDRVIITKLFWKLGNTRGIKNYVSAYTVLFESNITKKYNLCVKYFEDLCSISEHWAKCFQNDESIRGSNTNDYVES